jgi:hypothetical protein
MKGPKPVDPAIRFFAKVEKTETCWLWAGCIPKRTGYGAFYSGSEHGRVTAHRWSYEYCYGPIPEGMQIDHICRVRACVNPQHLRVVTNKQNTENAEAKKNNRSSGFRGVYFDKRDDRWYVKVMHNRKNYSGGYFDKLDEAVNAAVALRNSLFTHNDTDRHVHVAVVS